MAKHLKEKWAELLISALLLPVFVIVWTMRGDLSKVDGTLDGVVHRVDRIADSLPDLRVRIASEELSRQPKTLLLTSQPQKKGNLWSVTINVLDTIRSKRDIYSLVEVDQNQAKFTAAGLVYTVASGANSFTEMEKYSSDAKQTKFAPPTVEKSASFVSYTDTGEILANLKRLGYQPQESYLMPSFKIRDWPSTVDALVTGSIKIEGATLN
jgi:hypothetical protein